MLASGSTSGGGAHRPPEMVGEALAELAGSHAVSSILRTPLYQPIAAPPQRTASTISSFELSNEEEKTSARVEVAVPSNHPLAPNRVPPPTPTPTQAAPRAQPESSSIILPPAPVDPTSTIIRDFLRPSSPATIRKDAAARNQSKREHAKERRQQSKTNATPLDQSTGVSQSDSRAVKAARKRKSAGIEETVEIDPESLQTYKSLESRLSALAHEFDGLEEDSDQDEDADESKQDEAGGGAKRSKRKRSTKHKRAAAAAAVVASTNLPPSNSLASIPSAARPPTLRSLDPKSRANDVLLNHIPGMLPDFMLSVGVTSPSIPSTPLSSTMTSSPTAQSTAPSFLPPSAPPKGTRKATNKRAGKQKPSTATADEENTRTRARKTKTATAASNPTVQTQSANADQDGVAPMDIDTVDEPFADDANPVDGDDDDDDAAFHVDFDSADEGDQQAESSRHDHLANQPSQLPHGKATQRARASAKGKKATATPKTSSTKSKKKARLEEHDLIVAAATAGFTINPNEFGEDDSTSIGHWDTDALTSRLQSAIESARAAFEEDDFDD